MDKVIGNYIKEYRSLIIISLCVIYYIYNKYKEDIESVNKELKRNFHYLVSIWWNKDDTDSTLIEVPNIRNRYNIPSNLQASANFIAGTPIDIYNNGREAIFIGGRKDEHDALLLYNKSTNKMDDIITSTKLDDIAATHSAVAIDLDRDGYSDMIIARQNGVFLYLNNKDGTFKKSLLLNKKKDSTPLAITISDYDKDGNPDIYVSQFIDDTLDKYFQFHSDWHSKENTLLKSSFNTDINKLEFKEVDAKTLGIDNKNNTFTSIFTDIDKDGYPDIININDTGMLGVYKNIKGKRFEKKDVFGKYGSYMGVAVGDIDQDGDQDYYISNIGNTIKVSKTTRGNLKDDEVLSHDHIILRNDGKFKFTEIGKKMGINNAGFSWGANFIDFNLDTYLDLLVAQNFTEIATHQLAPLPGQRWKYDPNIKKYVKEDKYKNPHYGQAPLSIDVDGDGIKDIVWINMKNPIKIYKGTKPENNNYINISLPNDIRFANAQVEVKTNNKIYTKEYIIGGTGFGSKMSSILQFGLGEIKKIDKVRIKTIYGNIYTYNKPKINSTLIIKT